MSSCESSSFPSRVWCAAICAAPAPRWFSFARCSSICWRRGLCFGRGFAFFLGLCPPCLCRFAGKLLPLLWRERCHSCFSALAFCCLPAFSAHLAHHFGN